MRYVYKVKLNKQKVKKPSPIYDVLSFRLHGFSRFDELVELRASNRIFLLIFVNFSKESFTLDAVMPNLSKLFTSSGSSAFPSWLDDTLMR